MSDEMFAPLTLVADDKTPPSTSYDELPYESHPFAQTHPSRLFTLGTLFGMRPTPVQRCRVLELACAAGGNLIPMADYLRDSEFVGIDLSAKQIADGQQAVAALGLKNVVLRQADIMEVDAAFGTFDYIIAHGVFSWVPVAVRQKILDVCAKLLTPNGIAYVSYNTFPGWHMRGMIRDMMRYHSGRFARPQERVVQARALLDFLAQSVKQEGPYSQLLKAELETIRHQADHYLYHEHLEDVNHPLYFHEFADMARAKGLKYLGEARIATMVTGNFGAEVEQTLRLIATDQIQAEQYMDFLRNRTFRESLLCREAVQPNWSVVPENLRGLHVSSSAKPATADGNDANTADDSPVAFQSPGGMNMTTNRPLLKTAMAILQEAFPATVPFEHLRRSARERLGGGDPAGERLAAEDTTLLAVGLLNCYMSSDLVELYGMPVTFARTAGERPKALPLVRIMAAKSGVVVNRRHEVVRLNELDRHMLPMLDGTNDRAALVERLAAVAAAGGINVQKDGQNLQDPTEVRAALASVIDQALANVARMAVLEG